ncbi:MAG TPA: hypothetical protein VGN76_02015 [Gemmatimonadales bacterium]|jgi:hypothetical protein|nr:hypothetical protein [Gemmatimonadales bacterium]
MRPSLLGGLITVVLSSCLWSSRLAGQWLIGVEVGSDRFWGGSVEKAGAGRSFRPYRPTTFGVGLGRRSGPLGVGLWLHYMAASLALEGSDALVAAKGVFDVFGFDPEIIYHIASIGAGNSLLLRGGPLVEIWKTIDEPTKTLVGGQAALSMSVPLGGRLAASVLARIALTSSPFTPSQIDPNFEPRALWRRGISGRLEYRL